MNKPYDVLRKIAAHGGKNDKRAILATEAKVGNDEFFAGCNAAFNSFITYGVKKVASKQNVGGTGLSWKEFKTVLDKLAARKLTGDAARAEIVKLSEKATVAEWDEWYRLILTRDLRAKFSEESVNKVVGKINKKYLVPVYDCQLAKPAKDNQHKMNGKKIIDYKLDGTRLNAKITPGVPASEAVELKSRNGKVLTNFPHIEKQLATIANYFDEPMLLDGEIMSASFQSLMKQLNRKTDVKTDDAIFNMFDIVPYADFENGLCEISQLKRRQTLDKFYADNKSKLTHVVAIDHEVVDLDAEKGQDRMEEIFKTAILAGLEGIMVKDLDAPYECKRSSNWLKIKPVATFDLKVIDVEAGKEGKQFEHTLGGLVCEGVESGKHIVVNVGSGYSEEQRDEFWAKRKKLIGMVVEISGDAITKSENKDTWSIRFPRFVRFRGFKPGEKL